MADLELDQFVGVVDATAERYAHEILQDRNVPEPADYRKAIKYLNDAVADSDLHGVAVYAHVLHIFTEL